MCNGKTNLQLCGVWNVGGGEVEPNIRGRLYILDKMVEVLNAIIVGNFNLNLTVHNSDSDDLKREIRALKEGAYTYKSKKAIIIQKC